MVADDWLTISSLMTTENISLYNDGCSIVIITTVIMDQRTFDQMDELYETQ